MCDVNSHRIGPGKLLWVLLGDHSIAIITIMYWTVNQLVHSALCQTHAHQSTGSKRGSSPANREVLVRIWQTSSIKCALTGIYIHSYALRLLHIVNTYSTIQAKSAKGFFLTLLMYITNPTVTIQTKARFSDCNLAVQLYQVAIILFPKACTAANHINNDLLSLQSRYCWPWENCSRYCHQSFYTVYKNFVIFQIMKHSKLNSFCLHREK